MEEQKKNTWKNDIGADKILGKKEFDLNSVYERAHQELSLQQSKRDQIITIYLALCSFLIPFVLGEDGKDVISYKMKGLIFFVIAVVGILFSLIVVRYREYKEVYWLCCQSITVLHNVKPERINKETIQQVFYHCLRKKGKGFYNDEVALEKLIVWKYVKKNIFSAETLHYIIIAILTAFLSALGAYFVNDFSGVWKYVFAGIIAGVVFVFLMVFYFYTCIKIYGVMKKTSNPEEEKEQSDLFKKVFSKAWFLHMYYEVDEIKKKEDEISGID